MPYCDYVYLLSESPCDIFQKKLVKSITIAVLKVSEFPQSQEDPQAFLILS